MCGCDLDLRIWCPRHASTKAQAQSRLFNASWRMRYNAVRARAVEAGK